MISMQRTWQKNAAVIARLPNTRTSEEQEVKANKNRDSAGRKIGNGAVVAAFLPSFHETLRAKAPWTTRIELLVSVAVLIENAAVPLVRNKSVIQ